MMNSGASGSSIVATVEKDYKDQVQFDKDLKAGKYGTYIPEVDVNAKGQANHVTVIDDRSDFDYLFSDANSSAKNPYEWTPEELKSESNAECRFNVFACR